MAYDDELSASLVQAGADIKVSAVYAESGESEESSQSDIGEVV